MVIWFPTLHFLPRGQHNESQVKCLLHTNFKGCLRDEKQREKKIVWLYIEARKSFLFLPSQKKKRKTSPFEHMNLWLKLDRLFSMSFYTHFCLFHPLSLCALFLRCFTLIYLQFTNSLFTESHLLIFPWVINFDHDDFHFCSQLPDKILNFVSFHWAQ